VSQSRRGEPPIILNAFAGRSFGLRRLIGILLVIGVPLVVISVFFSGATVQAGHVGVLLTFGRVEDRVLSPGFHLIMPFAQRIVQVETRVLPHSFKEIDAASSELQGVKLTGTMNYHLRPARPASSTRRWAWTSPSG